MELAQWKERIDAWFADKEPEMLALLERLVNMDSFTSDAEHVNRVGETICAWMRDAGFRTEKIAKAPVPADEPWMATLGNVFTARTLPHEARRPRAPSGSTAKPTAPQAPASPT